MLSVRYGRELNHLLRRALFIAMTDADQCLSKAARCESGGDRTWTTHILECVSTEEFDYEVRQAMGAAFNDACKALDDTGQPPIVRDVMASRIIEAARQGERDPDPPIAFATMRSQVFLDGRTDALGKALLEPLEATGRLVRAGSRLS
jgi:hypothetical protein